MKWLLSFVKDITFITINIWVLCGQKPRITFTCERSEVYSGSLKVTIENE